MEVVDNNLSTEIKKEDTIFRNYESAPEHVKRCYYASHTQQTYDYVISKKKEIYPVHSFRVKWKELNEKISNITDESDPDFIEGSQLVHNLYTAEACKILFPDEDWMHLVGFLHDFGKILIDNEYYSLPAWAVVGDTFPVGCKFSEQCIFYDYFKDNKDYKHEVYSTELGIYEKHCGFDNVHFSFSHDEYMYQFLLKNQNGTHKIPDEGLYVIRYHSFYPWHQHQAYSHLASQKDWDILPRLKLFQNADLYTKIRNTEKEELLKLLPYYESLIEKYVTPLNDDVIV